MLWGVAPSVAANNQLFSRILWGIAAGAVVGLIFGETVAPLSIVSTAFIRLLQANVLPYLLGSLLASLGSRSSNEMRVIARYGVLFLLLAWGLALALVLLCQLALPPFAGAPVFGLQEAPAAFDWLDLYIPSNLFRALSNNLIPAVVLFGILAGLSLGQIPQERKAVLLQALDAFNDAMARVSRMVLKLTPYGLFTMAAVTAGQIRFDDLLRLQIWFHFYAGGTLLLTLWVLPALVARFTPIHHGRFLNEMRSAIITAAAAGDVLVVLPLITESGKALLVETGTSSDRAESALTVAVPLLYNFPNVGKIMSLAFLPFAAWFSGGSLSLSQLGMLITAGPLSLFGSINVAVPFLLDLLRLPADLFELFTVSSVVNSHFGAMAAATHVAALSLLVATAMLAGFRIVPARLARFVVITLVLVVAFVGSTRAVFTWVLPPAESGLETLAPFELRPPLVASKQIEPDTRDHPHVVGERLREIKERGVLRVGYFGDAVPWAFKNAKGELVGHDIEAAHRLARDLGVTLEFMPVLRTPPFTSTPLNAGRVDIVMTGFTATLGRAERMELSRPYSNEHTGLLVRDYDRSRFAAIAEMNEGRGIIIGVPPLEGVPERVRALLPQVTLRPYDQVEDVIDDPDVTAIWTTMERAYYWSRVRPELSAVRPEGITTGTITVYAMPRGETEWRDLINLWIETRLANGESEDANRYWIQGRGLTKREPRWSIVHNVLGWN